MRAIRRAERARRVSRIVCNVLERQWLPLERAWDAECTEGSVVDASERAVLRDISSGTLRHLHYYERLLDYVEPRIARDVQLRVLASATLYQAEHMDGAPSLSTLCRAAGDCSPSRVRSIVEAACETIAKLPTVRRREMLCPASSLSLPSWLHLRLRGQGPLPTYSSLLLQRPSFLGCAWDAAGAAGAA